MMSHIDGYQRNQVENMASNDEKEEIKKGMKELEAKVSKIEDNVKLLTTIFEQMLSEFDKIKKDMSKENSK